MNVQLPASAFFPPPPAGENSGVDFLNLRQANLDMMAELIPGVNNVTVYIRPFSLLCWVYWKFHALCVEADIAEPTSDDLRAFRERIEVLFTWGARLENYPAIPGKQAEPPAAGSGPRSTHLQGMGEGSEQYKFDRRALVRPRIKDPDRPWVSHAGAG